MNMFVDCVDVACVHMRGTPRTARMTVKDVSTTEQTKTFRQLVEERQRKAEYDTSRVSRGVRFADEDTAKVTSEQKKKVVANYLFTKEGKTETKLMKDQVDEELACVTSCAVAYCYFYCTLLDII